MLSFTPFLKRTITKFFFAHMRRSYSQSGEDIIISDLFNRLRISNPTYLDIGANDAIALSNTYRLYTRGCRGVCVEPNYVLFGNLKKKRKGDICINAGVAFNDQKEATYYIFPEKYHGLNTFSRPDAEFWETDGALGLGKPKIEKEVIMPMVNINLLIEKYLKPHPNLISIDVEGLDLQILKTLNFEKYKPEVFCVETLQHAKNYTESKNQELISFLKAHGYFVYADTYINTIFCRRDSYKFFI